MGTIHRSKHRDRTAGCHPAAREADRTGRPLPDPVDHEVAVAEEIVGDAWVRVLAGHRDLAITAMKATAVHCDDARRALAVAVFERDPVRIATARTRFDMTVGAARRAAHD